MKAVNVRNKRQNKRKRKKVPVMLEEDINNKIDSK